MTLIQKKFSIKIYAVIFFVFFGGLWGCSSKENLPFLFIENPYYANSDTTPTVRFNTKSAVRCNIQMQKNNNEKSVFHIDVHNSPKILQKIFSKNFSKKDFLVAQEKNFLISKNFYSTKSENAKQEDVRLSLFVNFSSAAKTKTTLQKIQHYGKQFDYVFLFWEEEQKEKQKREGEDVSLPNKSKILPRSKSETVNQTEKQIEDKKNFTLLLKNLVIKKAVFVFYKKQNQLSNFLTIDGTANDNKEKENTLPYNAQNNAQHNAQKTSDDYFKKYRNYVVDSPFYAELFTTENPLLVPIIYFSRTFSFRG